MKMIQKGLFRVCFQPITMMNCCTTCILREIGSYNTQQSRHNEHTHFCPLLSRNPQYDFPKMRGGRGVKGRLEFFRKFIQIMELSYTWLWMNLAMFLITWPLFFISFSLSSSLCKCKTEITTDKIFLKYNLFSCELQAMCYFLVNYKLCEIQAM